MNTANKALFVSAFVLCNALPACGGQVAVEGSDAVALEAAGCESCFGTATVDLAGLGGLGANDPDLNIDLCVGVSCGQALVAIAPLPAGSYPEGCIVDGDEVGCCFASPSETMPDCSAAPRGTVSVTMTLPLGVGPGTTLPVVAYVTTMQGQHVVDLDGDVMVESCGESCVTGETIID